MEAGDFNEWLVVKLGVPQGWVLGPVISIISISILFILWKDKNFATIVDFCNQIAILSIA